MAKLLRISGSFVALSLVPALAGSAPRTATAFVPRTAQSPLPGLGSPGGAPLGGAAPAVPEAPSAPIPSLPRKRAALKVLPTGGIKMETAALLVSGQEGGPIPLAAVAYPLPGEGGRSRVAVVVEIEGAALLGKQSEGLLHADVFLYALDAQGALAGSSVRTVEVDLAQLGGDVREGGIKLLGEVALPPGEASLRVLVRNVATGDMGMRVLPVSVPSFADRVATALVAPMLLAPREPWLVVGSAAGRPGPFSTILADAGEAARDLPAALPILTPDHEAKVELAAYNLAAAADLRIEVLGAGGRVADLPARLVARRAAGAPGLEVLTLAFTLQGVPEGRYAVRAKAGETASGLGQVLVLPDGGGGRAWAELTAISRARQNGEATPSAAAAAASRARGRRRKPETAAIFAAYNRALGRLAEGDSAGASAAIAELEVKALTGEEMLTGLELRELELDAVHAWTGGGRDRLTQILTLYTLIYRDAWTRQRFLTAGHAGAMVARLVDDYVKSDAPDARKLGGQFLVALTPRATGAGLSELVQHALLRALDLDHDNEAALLCLAVDAERRGHYVDAVRWLERLKRAHPENREARLRLALSLAKDGRRADAERQLRSLAEERSGQDDWITAVAWQELARSEIADGRLPAAERTLAAGLARLPGDEKLAIERAFLLDLRNEPGRAEEALPARAAASSVSGSSARLRYDELPQEILDRSWDDLRHGLAARLPSLAGILAAPLQSAGVLP